MKGHQPCVHGRGARCVGSGHGPGVSLRLENRSKTTILRIYGFWEDGRDREGGCHALLIINLPPAAGAGVHVVAECLTRVGAVSSLGLAVKSQCVLYSPSLLT